MSWLTLIETGGVVLGLCSVYYAAKENELTWPTGIANVILFGVLFWANKLYVNVGLQIFFALYSVYSWWMWRYGGVGRQAMQLALTPDRAWWPVFAFVLAATLMLGLFFDFSTDNPLPYWDAATVALSVAAQFMLTQKWLENWWLWIVANVIYIHLGLSSQSYQFVALQGVYIALSVMGYRNWRRDLRLVAQALPSNLPE